MHYFTVCLHNSLMKKYIMKEGRVSSGGEDCAQTAKKAIKKIFFAFFKKIKKRG